VQYSKEDIEKIAFCQTYGSVETIQHSLFESTWAKLFRQEIKAVTGVKIPDLHPSTWAIDIIDSTKIKPADAAIILCGGWAIWSERNARNHGEHERTILAPVKWTIDIAMDLAMIGGRANSKQTPKARPRWDPPVEGVMKTNVDAGFSNSSGEGTMGLVHRNHVGSLIQGQAIW
jgi:hypothetical protein